MRINNYKPEEIEKKSFEIISEELNKKGISLPTETANIIKRCIHTTADFDYAETLRFSPDAVNILKDRIKNGADIVTDTNMALTGINKKEFLKYGGSINCYMADEDIVRLSKENETTRASESMLKAMQSPRKTIFVCGNAPTALITLYEKYKKNEYVPAFIVGVPVGFVNVEAAKELIQNTEIPHIINEGRKGGSNVAAAIVNAVLYDMRNAK